MKSWVIFKKNIKVMMRSKTSAFAVVFGPLLVVVLISLAFNKPSMYDLNVGISVPLSNKEASNLSQDLQKSLEMNSYTVHRFSSQNECVDAIKQGIIHTCIFFPNNFSTISGNKELEFFVDYSRANLVWAVIDAVGSNIKLKSSQISLQYTGELLKVLEDVRATAEQQALNVVNTKSKLEAQLKSLGNFKSRLSSTDLSTMNISLKDTKQELDTLKDSADNLESSVSSKVNTILGDENASSVHNTAQDIGNMVSAYADDLGDSISSLKSSIDDTSEDIESLNQKLSNAKTNLDDIVQDIGEVETKLSGIITDLSNLQSQLEGIDEEISSIKVKNAERIANPITTSIKPVVSENSQIAFMAPYLVMLLVMFVGLLLSGTIVVIERNSKAFFRNFTTPTHKDLFLISNYFTSLFLLLIQVAIIVAIGYYFIDGRLFHNYQSSLLLILLSSSLFIFLGMALGYLFPTQEGVTIGSLSLGSFFLLLSNLVLPVETMSKSMKIAASYNPYVISSELFRKLLFFDMGFTGNVRAFIILTIYSLIVLLLLMAAHRFTVSWYFNKIAYKSPKVKAQALIIRGKKLMTANDMLSFVKDLTVSEFKRFATENAYELKIFARQELKSKKLAKAFKKLDKGLTVKLLEQLANRQTKIAKR